ncbi:hypothetical protein BJ912DRAFT_1059579 [Pholiota molesta]|nr:hypothetical protein BJ912DRAFT_1059579 [Pholiota molesta]
MPVMTFISYPVQLTMKPRTIVGLIPDLAPSVHNLALFFFALAQFAGTNSQPPHPPSIAHSPMYLAPSNPISADNSKPRSPRAELSQRVSTQDAHAVALVLRGVAPAM